MTTDTTEKGIESLVVDSLTSEAGYVQGDPKDYDRAHAVDMVKLVGFLQKTQPEAFDQLGIASEGPARLKFLARLQGEIAKRGVVDLLRKGIQHGPAFVELFYGTPKSVRVAIYVTGMTRTKEIADASMPARSSNPVRR